jgi:hypothetical protein
MVGPIKIVLCLIISPGHNKLIVLHLINSLGHSSESAFAIMWLLFLVFDILIFFPENLEPVYKNTSRLIATGYQYFLSGYLINI